MTTYSLLIANPELEVSFSGRVQNAALYRSIRPRLQISNRTSRPATNMQCCQMCGNSS